jgi:hypothetical protein
MKKVIFGGIIDIVRRSVCTVDLFVLSGWTCWHLRLARTLKLDLLVLEICLYLGTLMLDLLALYIRLK